MLQTVELHNLLQMKKGALTCDRTGQDSRTESVQSEKTVGRTLEQEQRQKGKHMGRCPPRRKASGQRQREAVRTSPTSPTSPATSDTLSQQAVTGRNVIKIKFRKLI